MNGNIIRLLTFLLVAISAGLAEAQEASATLSLDGKPVLALAVPAKAEITSSNGYVKIKTANLSLYVWALPKAKTVAKAVPLAADIIKGEFVKFATTSTTDETIAGATAKHIFGSGNEADDGDPGHAEVVIFAVGKHVFAACIHGEFDDAAHERTPMMAVLQSAHSPP